MNNASEREIPLLSLRNISYDYITKAETVHAVKDATYDFYTKKIYAITGRSGSGKTTLMSLIAGFDSVKSGEILYSGQRLDEAQMEKYRRKNIGMVFQSYYLLPQLTVKENIMLSLEISGSDKRQADEKIKDLLSKIDLPEHYSSKRVMRLSGGEQQRVAIARAIAPDPVLIIADEPTGNLDNENSQNIVNILKKLAYENGKCVIIITHAGEIAEQADYILNMTDGVLLLHKSFMKPR